MLAVLPLPQQSSKPQNGSGGVAGIGGLSGVLLDGEMTQLGTCLHFKGPFKRPFGYHLLFLDHFQPLAYPGATCLYAHMGRGCPRRDFPANGAELISVRLVLDGEKVFCASFPRWLQLNYLHCSLRKTYRGTQIRVRRFLFVRALECCMM